MSLQTCFFTAFHQYFELLETNGDLQTCFFTAWTHLNETVVGGINSTHETISMH